MIFWLEIGMYISVFKIVRGVINLEVIVDCVFSISYILVYICIVYLGYFEILLLIILLFVL